VLEQTFVDDGMIPSLSSLLHTPVETACPYGQMAGDGASKYLSA
jgi:hypothetical protein